MTDVIHTQPLESTPNLITDTEPNGFPEFVVVENESIDESTRPEEYLIIVKNRNADGTQEEFLDQESHEQEVTNEALARELFKEVMARTEAGDDVIRFAQRSIEYYESNDQHEPEAILLLDLFRQLVAESDANPSDTPFADIFLARVQKLLIRERKQSAQVEMTDLGEEPASMRAKTRIEEVSDIWDGMIPVNETDEEIIIPEKTHKPNLELLDQSLQAQDIDEKTRENIREVFEALEGKPLTAIETAMVLVIITFIAGGYVAQSALGAAMKG